MSGHDFEMSETSSNGSGGGKNEGGKDGARLQGPGKRKPSDASALYDPGRAMPSAVDMERCVLSCMMQAPDYAVGMAMEKLSPDHFNGEAHATLYDLIVRQFDAGKPVDPVSITQVLYDRDLIGRIGGAGAVTEIYTAAPSPAHVRTASGVRLTIRRMWGRCWTRWRRGFWGFGRRRRRRRGI